MKKKIWIAVVVVLAILGIAGGIFYKNYRDKKIYEEKVNNSISNLNTYIGEFDNKENVSDKIKVVDVTLYIVILIPTTMVKYLN